MFLKLWAYSFEITECKNGCDGFELICIYSRTTDTQWRHKSKKSEKLGRCGRQNMLRPYLKIWEWEWIFGCAVKVISSPGVRSPCSTTYFSEKIRDIYFFYKSLKIDLPIHYQWINVLNIFSWESVLLSLWRNSLVYYWLIRL